MNNFEAKYELILKELKNLDFSDNFYFKPIKPKLSDLELIAINITAEYLSIDSEYQLFRYLQNTPLNCKIERSVYNKRKRKLFVYIEEIRKKLVSFLSDGSDYYIVDSMPLEICKNARANRSKICKKVEYAIPNKGYCASQATNYYGYKLHAICSVSGVFQSFDLSPASVHDIHYLKDIKHQMFDCKILGDRGYLSESIQLDLFRTVKIKLETPMRINQKEYKPQPYIF